MTQARRTAPLHGVHARNYVIAASTNPFATYPFENRTRTFVLAMPLRAYMVGVHPHSSSLVAIANVTIPEGARLVESWASVPDKPSVPAYEAHTVEVDSVVSLDMHFRYAMQIGGFRPTGRESMLYLGMQVAPEQKPFEVFIDQGNALRYARVKR
jgi:hypothetical protein